MRVGELKQKQASVGNNSSDSIAGLQYCGVSVIPPGRRLSLERSSIFFSRAHSTVLPNQIIVLMNWRVIFCLFSAIFLSLLFTNTFFWVFFPGKIVVSAGAWYIPDYVWSQLHISKSSPCLGGGYLLNKPRKGSALLWMRSHPCGLHFPVGRCGHPGLILF